MYRKFKPPFFLTGAIAPNRRVCQSLFCLMKIAVLLRSARAAQRSERREVFKIAQFLANILVLPLNSPLRDHATSLPNLLAYSERMKERYFK
jgi:hypothetical protein